MLDWIIVGGGPHGVHMAASLIADAGVSREAVAILDDEAALLARWRRCTKNTGMRYLRSPAVHHLGPSGISLQRFASSGAGRRVEKPFTRPYSRPSLELFDLHSKKVIETLGLESLHVPGRANGLQISDQGVRVGFTGPGSEVERQELQAKNVVLALGAPQEPNWPDWAKQVASEASDAGHPAVIRHIFDPAFKLVDDGNEQTIAVVGAGISGAQVAIALAQEGRRVVLLSRHALRVHQFDSDPGWQGPMHMSGYSRVSDPAERRARIHKARHRGSIPPDVHTALRCAFASGTIEHLENAQVERAGFSDGQAWLDLGDNRLVVDRILLATGFETRRPGAGWLDQAIEDHRLPCGECGYPLTDRRLRWHPRLFVTGSLAELEIGPVSRNLSGAQRASERIVPKARKSLGT